MGASADVAVVMVTRSDSAHNEEIASPRNPKVCTDLRSSNTFILEVWCLRPGVIVRFIDQ